MTDSNVHYHKMYEACFVGCPKPHYTEEEAEDRYDQWMQEWALELENDVDD